MSSSQLIRVEEVAWSAVWPEGAALFFSHEKELNLDDPRIPFGIDHELCEKCYELGILRIIAAKRGPQLVGYCFWYVSPSLVSRGTLCASQGPYYVVPELRGTSCAVRLWNTSLEMLRKAGVRQVMAHRAQKSPKSLEKLFAKHGGTKSEEVWEIIL